MAARIAQISLKNSRNSALGQAGKSAAKLAKNAARKCPGDSAMQAAFCVRFHGMHMRKVHREFKNRMLGGATQPAGGHRGRVLEESLTAVTPHVTGIAVVRVACIGDDSSSSRCPRPRQPQMRVLRALAAGARARARSPALNHSAGSHSMSKLQAIFHRWLYGD